MGFIGRIFGCSKTPAPPVNGTTVGNHSAPSKPDVYGVQECVTRLIDQGVINPGAKNIWREDYLGLNSRELPKLSWWETVKALGISETSAVCYWLPGFLLVLPLAVTRDLFRGEHDFAQLSARRRLWSQPFGWHHHAQALKVERAIRKGLVEV